MKHVLITETDDVTAALRDAARNVAIAKLSQFDIECERLGAMAGRNPHRKQEVVDCLYSIAANNGLSRIHGGGLIEELVIFGLDAGQ